MAGDWIKLHRKVLNSAVGSDLEMLGLWVAILLEVNWKPGWFKMREIHPGQMAFSWRNLGERLAPAAKTKPSVNRLRRMIRVLEQHRMVKVEKVGRSYSVLTVCNWETYQSSVSTADTPSDTRPDTPSDTRPDTDRRRFKKGKKGNNKFSAPTIVEIAQYAKQLGYAEFDAERFWNHYESNGWRVGKNPMKSWKSAVVNWQKNSQQFTRGTHNGRNPIGPGQRYDAAAKTEQPRFGF